VAELDLVGYLASKGLHGRRANGPEVAYPCFMECGESRDSRKRKLYVNTEDGFWTCFVCGAAGGTYLLQQHFGDNPVRPMPGTDPHVRRQVLTWAAEVGAAMLRNNDDVLLHLLNERGLSPETIIERKLGWVGGNRSLTGSLPERFSRAELAGTGLIYTDGPRAGKDFLFSHLLIPYISRGKVVQMRGRAWNLDTGGKYLTGPGERVRLYNSDDLDGAEDVIICEGEFDCMALKQALQSAPDDRVRRFGVVGLAGANGFKDEFAPYFEKVKRIYIGLDPDDTGRREAIKLKERFGTRARIVELPPELPKCDWGSYLLPAPAASAAWWVEHPHAGHTWQDVLALCGQASGRRVFSIGEAGHAWRARRSLTAGLKTGYSELDATIEPGLLPGQVAVILAKSGVGKTLVLCNMAYNMREHKVLIVSLEMTREEVYERLRRIYLFHHPLATDTEIELDLGNVYICDENRLGERDIGMLVDEFEVETGERPQVVMVDYLGYYARGQRGNSQYEKVTNAVMNLKAEAKAGDPSKRFVIISPAQVNRMAKEGKPIDMDDARDAGTIEETADFLLSLWRPDDALSPDGLVQPTGKVKMTVLKSRHGGKDRTYTLVMDLLTLAIVEDSTRDAGRANNNNHLYWRGYSYEDLRRKELAPVQLTLAGKAS
jgi:5S rRNA maturation endonuclease (ribonuclease M5)